ncbi:putative F-box protein At1g67623 [Raphanus sativus]|uniref:F-box protein At1g67623 n=1 Tax=Raphanus sativus TaxID=3726 RepID=A0A6J0K656_RAPSA|nr:putative F-box protein At1g67623 [Raphanus sativus]
MVSSSLHASCIFKNSNKRRVSLNSLPDDLLLEISSRTAASSLSAVRNLRLVSKTFKRTCDEKYVISRLSLHELTLLSWHQGPEPQRKARSLSNFYKRCRRNGNPEALYLKGVNNYFRRNQKHKGLKLLSQAAKKGNKEAIYIYGLILICGGGRDIYEEGPVLHGGETKQEGFKILSSLMKPLMSKTLKELVDMRDKIGGNIRWLGTPVMKELKRAYVPDKCGCDGRTSDFIIAYNCAWHRYGEDNDMNTSSACEICLWDHEVKCFFDPNE